MNFGHGALALGFCPSAKSKPVAEYCTVFNVSAPKDFDTLPIAALTSCADAIAAHPPMRRLTNRHLLIMTPPTSISRARLYASRGWHASFTSLSYPVATLRLQIDKAGLKARSAHRKRLTRETTGDGPHTFPCRGNAGRGAN